jgi:hypothetical protein
MQALRAAEYARAEAAGQSKTALKGLAKQLGCSGDPSIFRRLSYLDRNDVFALPIYHTAIVVSALLKRPAGIDRQDGWDRKISGRVLQTQTSFSSRKSSLKSAQKG